jgi:photosystem II stability/assembly factor-like uncharacterized protein
MLQAITISSMKHFHFTLFLTAFLLSSGLHAQRSDWKELGPIETPPAMNPHDAATGLGPINNLCIDPKGIIIYAGSNSGGLWKSSDRGRSWKSINNGLPQITGIQDIAMDPSRRKVLFISSGTSYGYGVYKTTDAGKTWKPTGLSYRQHENKLVERLLIDPRSKYPKTIVYALERNDRKTDVKRSDDGGITWNSICSKFPGNVPLFGLMELDKKDPRIIYFASNKELWCTMDAGETAGGWKNLSENILKDFKTGPAHQLGGILSVITEGNRVMVQFHTVIPNTYISATIHIRQSTDNGQTWTTVLSPACSGDCRGSMAVSPNDPRVIYYGGTYGVYKLDGRGEKMDCRLTSSTMPMTHENKKWIHDDIRAISIVRDRKGNEIVIAANDGGVSVSPDGGETWSYPDGNKGLGNLHFYGVGSSPDGNVIASGAHDNGVMIYDVKTKKWRNTNRHQDAGNCVIGVDSSGSMHIFAQFFSHFSDGTYLLLSSDGSNWRNVTPSKGIGGPRPMYMDIRKNLYVGFHDLYRMSINGRDQVNLTHMPHRFNTRSSPDDVRLMDNISAIGISASDSNYLYIAYSDATYGTTVRSKIWKTTTGGGSFEAWQDISAGNDGLMWTPVSGMVVDPRNRDKIWVCMESLENKTDPPFSKVWTYDGTRWENISTNIPNLPVNCLVFDSLERVLYAGTDAGIYFLDTLGQWQPFMKGSPEDLPKARVLGMEINYATRKLRASTYGRGLWETVLIK